MSENKDQQLDLMVNDEDMNDLDDQVNVKDNTNTTAITNNNFGKSILFLLFTFIRC